MGLPKKVFAWKLTKRQASGMKLWKFFFQIRACCALMSAFDKIAGTKKIAGKRFFCRQMLFLQSNAFNAGKRFFCRQCFS
jgi:hypothetical protein